MFILNYLIQNNKNMFLEFVARVHFFQKVQSGAVNLASTGLYYNYRFFYPKHNLLLYVKSNPENNTKKRLSFL